jgi:hypothetical protein
LNLKVETYIFLKKMDEPEIDNSMETFMTLFTKMFSETKYNLQALNKRMESMDKCFNNILLLNTDKPFDEQNEQNEQNDNNIIDNDNNENINNDNIPKNTNKYTKKSKSSKMTSKELDEIEKMFKDIDEPNYNYNTMYIGKKRNNKRNIQPPPALDNDTKNYYHDIQELLKNYSLDNDNDCGEKNDENKKKKNKNDENNKKKGKRGRKKKNVENQLSSESKSDMDYLVPEKNDGYTKFKEFKELKKKMNNKKYSNFSDEEEIDDDLDSDF